MLQHTILGTYLWDTMAGPIVGGVSGAVTLLVGLKLLGRRLNWAPPATGSQPPPDPYLHGSTTERRISVRRGGNPIEILVSDEEATKEPTRGWVVDRSMGGLCLMLESTVPPGTVLSILACNAPKGTPWTKVEVKTCRQEEDGWELGCKFVRVPAWSILLLFG